MKTAKRSKRALLATGAVLALVLAACGGAQPDDGGGGETASEGDGPAGEGDGHATAWFLTGGPWPAVQGSMERWSEANPDRTITFEEFGSDAYKERIRPAIGAGEAPTLIKNWTGGPLLEYVNNDQVIDITEASAELNERLLPAVANAGIVDGATYAVPATGMSPVFLYYNKDIFEDLGLSVPETWQETLDVIEALKDEDILPFALAAQSQWPNLMWIQYLTDRIGGPEVFQAVVEGQEDAWSDPAILEALEKIQELVEIGAFGDNYGSVSTEQDADVALVHTNQAAMVLHLSARYLNFGNANPEFAANSLGFAPFPEIEGGAGDPRNVVGNPANYFSVSSAASEAEQETAKAYIAESLYDEAMVEDLIEQGSVPPLIGIEDRLQETDQAEVLTFIFELGTEAPHFQLSWDQALPGDQAQELLTNLSRIFMLDITPEQFVENMNATL